MMNLKDTIKKNKILYAFAMAFKSIKDKGLGEHIWAINHDPLELTIEEHGDLYSNEIIYDACIKHDSMGFFGLLRWLCAGLIYADRFNFKPCIRVDKDCLYYDPTYADTENPLEYYFDLKGTVQVEDMMQSKNVVQFQPKHLQIRDLYYEDRESVKQFAEVWKKYLPLKVETEEQIKDELADIGLTENTLGVHYRGTDYKMGYKNHPIAVDIQETIAIVKNALDTHGFDKIFIASDEQDAIEAFREIFGDRIINFEDTLRSADGHAVHTSGNDRPHHKYLLGYEVLRDAWTLSMCKGLVAGHSNVSAFADVMKVSRGEEYAFFHIINKGKHAKGKVFRKP